MRRVRYLGISLAIMFLLQPSLAVFAQDSKPTLEKVGDVDMRKENKADSEPLKDNENPKLIGKRNINHNILPTLYSLEKEVRLGQQLAAQVDKEAKFIDDPIVAEYVNRVGQNLVLNSDAKVPFTIKVIDSDDVNAFALPGGFFYVNKGLILAADNEAELAGVMAHEIAHVAARHGARQATRGQIINWASMTTLRIVNMNCYRTMPEKSLGIKIAIRRIIL